MGFHWLVALFGATAVAAPQLSPYELPSAIDAALRQRVAGEPYAWLQKVGGADLAARSDATVALAALPPRERCALARAGLRAAALDVVMGAVVVIGSGEWLDAAECKHAVAIGMAHCNDENTPLDVADFFALMDGADVARLLANPGPMPREMPQFLDALHQRFGPEHFAEVEQLARGDDVLLRRDARRFLGVVRLERLRYASYLLSLQDGDDMPPDVDPQRERVHFQPRPFTLRPAGDGYPPLLAALLERCARSTEVLNHGDLVFAWRWAREAAPAEIDRPLLLQLAGCKPDVLRRTALEGLSRLGGDIGPPLEALAERVEDHAITPLLAWGELTRRGEARARERLRALTATSALALAVAWSVDREPVLRSFEVAFAGDVVAGASTLERLLEAVDEADFWNLPTDGFAEALAAAAGAAAATLDEVRLGLLLARPEFRTPRLSRRLLAELTAEQLETAPLAVLELADPEGLVMRLDALLASPTLGDEAAATAVAALIACGAEALSGSESGARIWQRVAAMRDDERRERLLIGLAARGSPGARIAVQQRLRGDDWAPGAEAAVWLAAAMASTGLDLRFCHRCAERWREGHDATFPVLAALLPPLRRGDGKGAVAALCALGPARVGAIDHVWTVDDASVTAYLQRCRDEREHGLYLWATGELARRGDAAARAEIESAIERRFYKWIDDMPEHVLTDGKSLARVPLLMTQVESNCCTFAVVASALADTFEVDAFRGEDGAVRRPDMVRATWGRQREHLRWSRIADRWLIWPD